MVFPYLKGFEVIKCGFFYLACGSIVCSVFVVIILIYLFKFLTIGIKALFLAKEGKICFLFLQNFFFREEKEGGALQVHI